MSEEKAKSASTVDLLREGIRFKGVDGSEYHVQSIPWVKKVAIRAKFMKIKNLQTGEVEIDEAGFNQAMVKACTSVSGVPMTDQQLETLDSKDGDVLEEATNMLNNLTLAEIKNLQFRPS